MEKRNRALCGEVGSCLVREREASQNGRLKEFDVMESLIVSMFSEQ